jgi:hypothetical protein
LEKEKRFGTGMYEAATSAPGFLFEEKKRRSASFRMLTSNFGSKKFK